MNSLTFTRTPTRDFLLTATQLLPHPIDIIFPFFADAANLEILTPPFLHFTIVTPQPLTMRTGLLIDYKLRLHGFPVRWQSEIIDWHPPHRFVDQQLRGPYKKWHHLHTFTPQGNATLVTDTIHYRVPFGSLIEKCFVRPNLKKIFTYRQQKLTELFPHAAPTAAHQSA